MNPITEMFERNIAAAVLREPETTEIARARRIIGLLVETLAGYAYGIVTRGMQVPTSTPLCRPVDLQRTIAQVLEPVTLTRELREKLSERLTDLSDSLSKFSELNLDSELDDRLVIEISIGWICACAVIERAPLELPKMTPRARNLWTIWCRLAGRPILDPRPDSVQSSGYIMRVG